MPVPYNAREYSTGLPITSANSADTESLSFMQVSPNFSRESTHFSRVSSDPARDPLHSSPDVGEQSIASQKVGVDSPGFRGATPSSTCVDIATSCSQRDLDDRWNVLYDHVAREDLQLTPVTHRLRETHPGCSTIKYHRKKTTTAGDKKRVHACSFQGYYGSLAANSFAFTVNKLVGQFIANCAWNISNGVREIIC